LANNKKQERYSDGSPEKTCPVCAPWLGWIYDGVSGSSGCNVENEDNLRIIVSMPYYYAEFQQLGDDYFRLDTRIYLEEGDHVKKSGQGIAAIVAKNPGSARPRNGFGIWEGLCLGNDKMLPAVRHVFVKAYALREKPIPQGAYVQVLNLSYYCSERIALLFKFFKTGRPALTCAGRTRTFPIVWFACGGPDKRLDRLKYAYSQISAQHKFYYDKNSKEVVSRVPEATDFPKHPQGMPHGPVVQYLSRILR
jgi:hypothetical protein